MRRRKPTRTLRRLSLGLLVAMILVWAAMLAGCRCPTPVVPTAPAVVVAPGPPPCLTEAPPRRPVLAFVGPPACPAQFAACLLPESATGLETWARRLDGWAGQAWARCGSVPAAPTR